MRLIFVSFPIVSLVLELGGNTSWLLCRWTSAAYEDTGCLGCQPVLVSYVAITLRHCRPNHWLLVIKLNVSSNTSSYSFHYNKDQWQALATEHNTICTQKVDVVYITHLIYNVIQVLIHRGKLRLHYKNLGQNGRCNYYIPFQPFLYTRTNINFLSFGCNLASMACAYWNKTLPSTA